MYISISIIYIYIYIVYIHHKKLHFSYKFILELYSFVSVYVCGWVCGCVGGTNMFSKFVICYKSTIKESLKLTKGIKWWHNIASKSENIKFTNTLKNNMQLGDEIDSTKRTKLLQNDQRNIKHKMAALSQLTKRGS